MKKWVIAAIIGVAFAGAGLWSVSAAIHAIGQREIHLAALENDYCRDEICKEGMARLVIMLSRETGIKVELVPWCMAANVVYTVQLSVMDGLKEKFANWMYQFCGNDEITAEDALRSISEPEDH